MIAILLCTYNGEKYLSQQIDSLLNQTYQDFTIYIHDDGSTDQTNKILLRYKNTFTNKIIILEDSIKRRGAKGSFMWLLNEVTADYYMFCDQDDIWLETKIEDTYKRMLEVESQHKNVPIVIHTDLSLIDKDGNLIHHSLWEYANFKVDISKKFKYLCFGNIVTGCTMLFNNKAKQVSLHGNNEYVALHDFWVSLMTAKYGIIENLKKQTILYRQHENNVAGCGKKATKLSKIPGIRTILKYPLWYNKNKLFFQYITNYSFLRITWNNIKYYFLIRL